MGTIIRYAAPAVIRPREPREQSATVLIFPGVRIERAAATTTPDEPPGRRRGRRARAKKGP